MNELIRVLAYIPQKAEYETQIRCEYFLGVFDPESCEEDHGSNSKKKREPME